jgi:hypothetical protein
MLKQGYDHFEVTRLEPKIDVCEKRYVFNAEASGKFSAAERCPAYRVPDDIAAAVRDKQHRDEIKTAELISRGTPAAPIRMGKPCVFRIETGCGPALQRPGRVGSIGRRNRQLLRQLVRLEERGPDRRAARLPGQAGSSRTKDSLRTQVASADQVSRRGRRREGEIGSAAGCKRGAQAAERFTTAGN